MSRSNFFKTLIIAQSVYYLVTALWGLIDINGFMAVTGPKTDTWLVKMVSLLILPVALCLLSFLWVKTGVLPAIILATTSNIAFAIVDFYYGLNDVISDIYLADGVAQLVLLAGWLILAVKQLIRKKNGKAV